MGKIILKKNVKGIYTDKDFEVLGFSYIGKPESNTAMYVSKKIEDKLINLKNVHNCLVFVEKTVNNKLYTEDDHCIVYSDNPQLDYAKFAQSFWEDKMNYEKNIKYKYCEPGYYVSETAQIGKNAYIEIGCIIGPDVIIGDNAVILAGSIIKNSIIGNNFVANEHSVIGASGFTMAEDEVGNKIRIPSLGKVIIGNHVEVGAHNNISCGSAGNTVIEDYVKLDSLIHVGHDDYIKKNTEITAGCILGGFVEIDEKSFIGLNTSIRNRIGIGKNVFVAMGSVVMKTIDDDIFISGNPARPMKK